MNNGPTAMQTQQDRTGPGDVLVVGAGMAGIACARALVAAGRSVRVIDKGRGIGGRMATRRVALGGTELRFDHGAQYVTASDPGFQTALQDAGPALAQWQDGSDATRWVGVPGISALPRALAAGLDLRASVEVTALARTPDRWPDRWEVTTSAGPMTVRHLVLTPPAPQSLRLLGAGHPLAPALAAVEIAPCLTLMAAFPPDSPRPFVSRRDPDAALAWIAQDAAKPGRASNGPVTWVAQAGPAFSAAHLEQDRDASAALMLPLLAEAIGARPGDALCALGHRWRYAQVTRPLGAPCLALPADGLWLAGDWCLGARVEAAWQSGTAVAQALLEGRDG